ncbi:serpin family protein [Patescibacteria group bacterium]|nr:serpin family protein [Patescibacteria group bacterium]MBU0777019.1 serpin family protein [Patescibacteria group bacterium]MBU0923085.1 serpin family protein [Patescibacteria group bacterium]MBU1066904.1 serpin family protein [Patescibacteria group bacterium]MBU1844894.1 serpin family protein [Patescibacteria group bacterium]
MEKETTQDSKTTIPEVQSEPKEDLQPVTQDPETQQISPEVVMDSESVINQPVKNKNKLLMIILVLLLILIGAGGFFGYRYYQSMQQPAENGVTVPVQTEEVDLSKSHNTFGFNLFKKLASITTAEDENVFISPTSISVALSMIYNAADGETKEELSSLLGFQNLSTDNINQNTKDLLDSFNSESDITLHLLNSLWGNKVFVFNQTFIDTLETYYEAEVSSVDFADPNTVDTINGWVNSATSGIIESVCSDLPKDGTNVLINAIYFNARWSSMFLSFLSSDLPFNNNDGEVVIHPFMKQTRYRGNYAETDNYQAIRLPYGINEEVAMIIVLPKFDVDEFIENIDLDAWNSILEQFEFKIGTIILPKFKVESNYQMDEILPLLGMIKSFTPEADYLNMLDDSSNLPYVSIEEIIHKAIIEVDEEGTEAAAVTAILPIAMGGKPPELPEFYMEVNSPFIFAIQDEQSGEILFIGTIKNLSK